MSLRLKLLFTSLVVTILSIAVLGGYIENSIRGYLLEKLEDNLEKCAILGADLASHTLDSKQTTSLDHLAKQLFRQTGYRFTFIDPSGKVLGDGLHESSSMDNHLNRPEVRDALTKGKGIQRRYSNTLEYPMLYLAVPVKTERSILGVARVSLSVREVNASINRIRVVLAGVILLSILFALLISAKVAQRIATPIQNLRTTALRIAAGDLNQKIDVDSSDEIGDLAYAFGQMATQIRSMITTATEDRNKIHAILSGMSDGIIVADPGGEVSLVNDAARSLLGLRNAEACQGTVIQVTRNYEIDAAVTATIKSMEPYYAEMRLTYPEERFISLLVTPVLDDNGELLSSVALLHEITQIRQLERIRRDFVASASHELRTPIASVRVMAESLLAGAGDDPELRIQFIQAILDSSNRLAALVDDLLTLSALEHPSNVLHQRPVTVQELVDRVMPLFSHRAQRKGLSLELDLPSDLKVLGDPDLLDHALTNLIDNAVKYTPSGSVRINAESRLPWVLIHVSDTGSGIASHHLPRIFERFYRVDKARSRQLGGTGLGLSIVKHVAEEHGGSIEVDSQIGQGTTFTLKLPAAR